MTAGDNPDRISAPVELASVEFTGTISVSTCWGCALFPNLQLDQAGLIAAIQADTRYKGEPHYSAALAVANIAADSRDKM